VKEGGHGRPPFPVRGSEGMVASSTGTASGIPSITSPRVTCVGPRTVRSDRAQMALCECSLEIRATRSTSCRRSKAGRAGLHPRSLHAVTVSARDRKKEEGRSSSTGAQGTRKLWSGRQSRDWVTRADALPASSAEPGGS
jgi:hypothetical protein